MSNINCPVDNATVNENRVRIVAFLVLLLAVLYVITSSWLVVVLLLFDFILRVFNLNAYSPLSIVSGEIVKLLKLKNKPVDRAPKKFAAFVGLIFLIIILLTLIVDLITFSKVIAGILILFASLESFVGFCTGCYVYSLLKRFKLVKELFE